MGTAGTTGSGGDADIHQFELFADDFQVYLQDDDIDAGLDSVSQNRLDGDDRYRIVLWPDTQRVRRVLKASRPGTA